MEGKKRINKRAASSLEFVLAFVLFAGVVLAIFFFFSPIKNAGLMSNSLAYAYNQIEKNAQTDLKEYSIVITSTTPADEIKVNLPNTASSGNARVESYYGEILPSKKEGDSVYFSRISSKGKENFAVIKLSDDFEQGALNPASFSSDYTISSSSSRKVISEKSMLSLKNEYDGSYQNLKSRLNMSSDFSFSLVLSDKTISAIKASIVKKETFADSKSVEVLKQDGALEFGYLNIKIW